MNRDMGIEKLSPEFRSRIRRLSKRSRVRAVLILEPKPGTKRESTAGQSSIRFIDRILAEYGGKRYSESPTVLGTISLETTPVGIRKLASSDFVRSILEDQPIRPLVCI